MKPITIPADVDVRAILDEPLGTPEQQQAATLRDLSIFTKRAEAIEREARWARAFVELTILLGLEEGISLRTLAEASGVSHQTVANVVDRQEQVYELVREANAAGFTPDNR